jgi:predicted phage terminase large subunit-like protein
MTSPDLIEKHCPICEEETWWWTDLDKCRPCTEKEAAELAQASKIAKTRKKKAKKKAAKRKKHAKREAERRAAPVDEDTEQLKAQKELARRELARRNLLAFILRYEPSYQVGWMHKVLANELMKFSAAVINQESPRLMITMPPRHGKSMQASQYWPAWHLGNHPEHEFINTSYAQSLQMDFSRKIQELVKSPDYHLLFGNLGVTKKNEAIERWSIFDYDNDKRTGGGILAAGVGGPITGRGAHVLLIDDPVKNREEAESEIVREGAKAWYSSTAYTRLAPGAGVLVIQTRWHDDDLSGWLLSEMQGAEKELQETGEWPEDADHWRVIDFPAIATRNEKYRRKGEALHPERYPLAALKKIKRTLAPRDWAALYQQNPQVEEGAYFQKKYLRTYKPTKGFHADLDIFVAGDLAISKAEHADWTVFYVAGLDKDGNVYFLDEFRGKWDAAEIIDIMFEIHRKWKPKAFGLEKGQISLTLDKFLQRRKDEEGLFDLHVEELPPGKADKELRARTIQGLMALGKVYWPEGALWVDEAWNELLRFPAGVKDDRVDAAAWIGKMIAERKYSGTKATKEKSKKSWRKKLAGYAGKQGRKKPHMAA